MTKGISRLVRLSILFLGIVFFVIGFVGRNLPLMSIGIIGVWTNNMMYALEKYEKRILFLAFQITFFCFLLGRTVVNALTGQEDTHTFTIDILFHTNCCLFLAIISLFVGYCFIEKYHFTRYPSSKRKMQDNSLRYSSRKYRSVRKASVLFFYLTYGFRILVEVEKAVYVNLHGYADTYVNFRSRFPYAVVKLSDACLVAYYIFIATMPDKKEFKIPTILYLISGVVGIFGGKRSELIIPILLIVLYCFVRNNINTGNAPWIQKKHIIVAFIAVPFLLVFMYSFGISRYGLSVAEGTFTEKLLGFFNNLGFSVNIISYEKLYETVIPERFFSFGDTTDYLRENIVTQFLFDLPAYSSQTVEKALYDSNFTQTLTYIYSPRFFLSGRGLGSSYIAEAYHDFGYIGVVFWSFIYCFVLKYIYTFENKGIISIALSFCALKYILLAPRTMASAFLTEYINVNNWLVIIVIMVFAYFLGNYKVKPANKNE